MSPVKHAAAMIKIESQRSIPFSFAGLVTGLSGSTITVTNVGGKLGNVAFAGSGFGTVTTTAFLGGDLHLTNGAGTVDLKLGTGKVTIVGTTARVTVGFVAVHPTGSFTQLAGASGAMTVVVIQSSRPVAGFAGVVTSYPAAGGKALGY
jgi:hypothetical protein